MRKNISKAKLLCVDGLEIFTVNPARSEEWGAVPGFTVRNLTNFKSTKEIYSQTPGNSVFEIVSGQWKWGKQLNGASDIFPGLAPKSC